MNSLLSCFFPTTVVLVDDSSMFLSGMLELLSKNKMSIEAFSTPQEALDYINGVAGDSRFNFENFTQLQPKRNEFGLRADSIDIRNLHKAVYTYNRFRHISTVVADYSMPGMNGIELCSKIQDKNIQKVLLTGVADEKIAVDAFNEGYINRFIKKGTEGFEMDVMSGIEKSIYRHFKIYTDDITRRFLFDTQVYLQDPVFANFFHNICFNQKYVEYYMLDYSGSYLFLEESGRASMLSVATEREIDSIIEIGLKMVGIASDVLDGLQSHDYMLVTQNGKIPPAIEWGRYLAPVRRLKGYQTYYFAMLDDSFIDIDVHSIRSFQAFQERSRLHKARLYA